MKLHVLSLAAEPIGQGGQLPAHFLVLKGKPYLLPYHFLGLHAEKFESNFLVFAASHTKAKHHKFKGPQKGPQLEKSKMQVI